MQRGAAILLNSTASDEISSQSSPLRHRILAWLQDNVPASRIQHILGVETLAIALAQQHQLSVEPAAQAALMHDLAKYFSPQKLLEIAQAEAIVLDPIDQLNPHVLHADVGAIMARQEFGIRDPEILQAIADHTLGRPAMSALSCIIFLADKLELGRGDTAELNELRAISYQNLQQAVWMTCDNTMQYLLSHRQLIHPRAIATRNWFLQQTHYSSHHHPNHHHPNHRSKPL